MTVRTLLMTTLIALALAADRADSAQAAAQQDPKPVASSQQFDFGMTFLAQGGACKDVSGTVTVPADWPNQQRVSVVQEDLPPGATVIYKKIEEVGRQMVVHIPSAPAGKTIRAVVTFEVERLSPPPMPQDTEHFTVPPRRKQIMPYLTPSPRIESDAAEVRKAAETAVGERDKAWDKVQAIHEWVFQNIQFAGGLENVQTTVQTLSARSGVCAEKNSLAVAMLRAQGIPARLVRIPGHCYYEACLLDGEGETRWFNGDASASPKIVPSGEAGGLILQKGDNVSIYDPATKRKTKGRFLAETATGLPQTRGASLQFTPISPAIGAKPVTPK